MISGDPAYVGPIPEPVPVGFFPKRVDRPDDWEGPALVREICSVSECLSKGPADWIERWLHNELGFFPTEAVARQLLDGTADEYVMLAYKVYPLRFADGRVEPWDVPLREEADFAGFERLGFDAVSRFDSAFDCSPLSCNLAANDYEVNRFCLLDHVDEAIEICSRISSGKFEPGPYHLFEVFRRPPEPR